jgi:hypothetical protein
MTQPKTQKTQNWYSLNRIPLFVRMTQDMLEISREQLNKLEKTKNKAYLLNDIIIAHINKEQTENTFFNESLSTARH